MELGLVIRDRTHQFKLAKQAIESGTVKKRFTIQNAALLQGQVRSDDQQRSTSHSNSTS
jgi:hypothetical protein